MKVKEMKDIEGIIFDWAGTTVDYGCFAPVQAFVEVFKHFGITPTMEEVREPMGMLKIDHIRTMLQMPRIKACWKEEYGQDPEEKDVNALFALFEEKLMSILHLYADPKPGIVETVDRLRSAGFAIGSTTGYTDAMMAIVAPKAKEKGYAPDIWFSPDSTGQKGRPYPYMVFHNMEALGLSDVKKVVKVGDTVSDIKEGKNAGVWSVGITVGSSAMGLTEEEYNNMNENDKKAARVETAEKFYKAGADMVFDTMEAFADYLLES